MEKPREGISEKERLPLKIHFLYSGHENPQELRGFAEDIQKADICALEGVGWNENSIAYFQNVSDGNIEPPEDQSSFGAEELRILHRSGKVILLIDIPIDHPSFPELFKLAEVEDRATVLFKKGELDGALRILREGVEEESKRQLDRERYMKSQILHQVETMTEYDLTLQKILSEKGYLNVVVILGAAHTQLYQDLKKAGMSVTQSFSKKPFIFKSSEEVLRRAMRGIEIPEDLLGKALFEIALEHEGTILIKDIPAWRSFLSTLTLDHIRDMSEQLAEGKTIGDFIEK